MIVTLHQQLLTLTLFLVLTSLSFAQPIASGNALAFDGVNDYVEMPNNTQVNFGTASFTIEAWIKTTDTDAVLFETSGGGRQILLRIVGGSLEAEVTGSLGTFTLLGDPVNTNKWTHVALVHTTGTGTSAIYVNGVQVQTSPADIGDTDTNASWFIGRAASGGSFYNGQMDEIRIWNRERLENEIRTRMCSFVKTTDVGYSDLVLYFPLDESGMQANTTDAINSQSATLNGFDFHSAGSGWLTSGARIGDYSGFVYGSTSFTNYNPSETTLNDQLSIAVSAGGTPIAIHLYYVEGPPNVRSMPSCVNDFDDTGYWGVLIIGAGSYTYTATYVYDPSSININFEIDLELVFRENSAATAWQCVPPANLTFDEPNNRVTVTGLTGTELLLTGPPGSLPVQLLSFEANRHSTNSVRLDWITAGEIDNEYFEVERSAEGQTFEVLTRIDGQGTTTERTHYTWIDTQPLRGANYYRLKQTDFGGTFSYSDIIYQRFIGDWEVRSYPNPAHSYFTLSTPSRLSQKCSVGLFNQQGQQVQTWQLEEGNYEHTLSLEGIPAGLYILKSLGTNYPFSTKVVKY